MHVHEPLPCLSVSMSHAPHLQSSRVANDKGARYDDDVAVPSSDGNTATATALESSDS